MEGMQLGEHNWNQIEGLTERVAVLPLGSFEQHGHHLPLLTDTMICTEIARRAEVELGDEALLDANYHRVGEYSLRTYRLKERWKI